MSHVTLEQRYTIEAMLRLGYKQKDIALAICKNKSVVSREINRNCDLRSGEYRHDLAQRKYKSRLAKKPKSIKFTAEIENYVKEKLAEKWSPEQISKTTNTLNLKMVSTERIYQYVISDKKKGGDQYKNLRRRKKYKRGY